MEFIKTNFVEEESRELGMTVGEYLKNSDFNYVIFYEGKVDTWQDGSPVVYGDAMEVISEIQKSNGFNEDGDPTGDWSVMTEWDFICKYCLNWLITYLANYICNNDDNEYDGVCWIHWLNGFNNSISIDSYTDILGAYVGEDGALSFLITNNSDCVQTFVGLNEFSNDVIYKIAMSVLCGLEYNQCAIE